VARPVKSRALDAGSAKDVGRIDAIWSDCRTNYGAGGPFLFGAFSTADAMFAPVVWRLHTYAVEVSPTAELYARGHDAASLAGMAGRRPARDLGLG